MKQPNPGSPHAASRLKSGRHSKLKGFTLTELLVVITIIAVLVALMFPLIGKIREKAHATKCVGNLKQWGIAVQSYASDNNGNVQWSDWPSIGSASRFYETSLGGIFDKASATMDGKSVYATQLYRRCPAQKWDKTGNGPVGYAMVRPDPKIPSSPVYNLRTAANPSMLLVMMDANSSGFVMNGSADLASSVAPLCKGPDDRHSHTAHAMFGDGHVGAYQWADIDGDSEEEQAMLKQWFTLR